MRKSTINIVFFSLCSLLWSCHKDTVSTPAAPHSSESSYDYARSAPSNGAGYKIIVFSWSGINWNSQPINVQPVTIINTQANLGHIIFNDPIVTLSNANSCTSCHASAPGKHNPQLDITNGASPIANTNRGTGASIAAMISDEKAIGHAEAGLEDAGVLAAKMKNTSYYPALFKAAYGTDDITPDRISQALSQYMAAMTVSPPVSDGRFADPFK